MFSTISLSERKAVFSMNLKTGYRMSDERKCLTLKSTSPSKTFPTSNSTSSSALWMVNCEILAVSGVYFSMELYASALSLKTCRYSFCWPSNRLKTLSSLCSS